MKRGRWLVLAGSVALFAAAIVHGSAFGQVSGIIAKSGLSATAAAAFKALWLMFSIHFVVLGVVCFVASGADIARRLVWLCALMPVADTVLMFIFLGVFVGTVSVLVAAGLYVTGASMLPRRRGHESSER
jgi:hypothetical protein